MQVTSKRPQKVSNHPPKLFFLASSIRPHNSRFRGLEWAKPSYSFLYISEENELPWQSSWGEKSLFGHLPLPSKWLPLGLPLDIGRGVRKDCQNFEDEKHLRKFATLQKENRLKNTTLSWKKSNPSSPPDNITIFKKKVLHLEIDWYLLPIDTQQVKITLGQLWDILISLILHRALQSCKPVPTPVCYGDKASRAMSPGKKDARISQCLPPPTSLKSVRKISQNLIYFFPAKIKLPSSCLSCWEHQEIEVKWKISFASKRAMPGSGSICSAVETSVCDGIDDY